MDKSIKSTPKDVFMHLLGIVALYFVAINFITLIFQYIDLSFPSVLDGGYYYRGAADSIRWAMAAIIIVAPVYFWVTAYMARDFAKNPEKRELKIRKWLVYFTLFVAAVTIISDLVALVYSFLGGDLTMRFILKVATVLAVALVVFIYYLRDLRREWRGYGLRILAWSVALVLTSGIVGGFFTAGSPFKARLLKFDERRVSDLQTLQGEIINYWMKKDVLPGNLEELRNDITGFRAPLDPKTGVGYDYQIAGELSFELCAIFELLSNAVLALDKTMPRAAAEPYTTYDYRTYDYAENWEHGAEKNCFKRTIDPELYPKTPKR